MPTLITLVDFNGSDGSYPSSGLILDQAGDLFGTTVGGGVPLPGSLFSYGTVFELTNGASGYASTPTTLVSFNFNNGASPFAGLIADANGNLFGTTEAGGADSAGTIFEIAKTGTGYASSPVTLANFNGSNGSSVYGGLVADAAGNLFGTTQRGGANGLGTVYELVKTSTGYADTPTILVSFNSSDGALPSSSLIIDHDGNLIGTTRSAGANGYGTVFEIAKTAGGYASAPTTLVDFNYANGAYPIGSLISDADGNLFGTTEGDSSGGATVFEIQKTAGGYAPAPIVLAHINTPPAGPTAALTMDAAGNLFGTTVYGGSSGDGTVFEITKVGSSYSNVPTVLASLTSSGGGYSYAALTPDAAGNLIGVATEFGGSAWGGAIFEVAGSGFVPLSVAISGVARQGNSLTATANGEVASYQWQELIGDTWVDQAGANGASYVVQQADIGRKIRVQITGNDNLTATSVATNAVQDSAGNQYVYDTADQTTIGDGLFQYVYGSATNTAVTSGGKQIIYSDGSAIGTTIYAGGTQLDWGVVSSTSILGGEQYVWGSATGTTITSGTQYVGGASSQTTIARAGEQIIYDGGTASLTTIAGKQLVYGFAGQTTINNGGLQFVHGTVTGTTVNQGGEQNVYADGSASGTTVNAGGVQVDWGGASDTTIAGGKQYVWGSATDTAIDAGGVQNVERGASASATTLAGGAYFFDGPTEFVWGSASGTTLSSGAQYVEFGGSADNTTISTNLEAPTPRQASLVVAKQFVYGRATNTVINDGGVQEVGANGTAIGTTINAGGSQLVHENAVQTTINGGSQIVWGAARNTDIISGSQNVLSGGLSDTTTLGAGTSEIVAVGGLAHNVVFGGPSATLFMANSVELQGSVSGWQAGDTITLDDIVFKGSTALAYTSNGGTGGILSVYNDTQNVTLSLLGQYTAADFAVTSDGNGGTSIVHPVAQPDITITPPLAA